MSVSAKQSTLSLFRKMSQTAAITVIVIGVTVLFGWFLDSAQLKSFVPGLVTMKVNTALGLVAAGGALWTLRKPVPTVRERRIARLLAVFSTVIGTFSLAEYIAGVDFGIDQLLFRDSATPLNLHPGRMAPIAALNFALLGLSLCLLESNARISQWLAVAILASSILAIVGYGFGVSSLYQVSSYSSVALHTAVCFALLALGVLTARPAHGFMVIVASDSAGGIVARRLLPLIPLVLFCLGLLRLAGELYGFYDGRFGLAIMVTLSMAVAVLLVAHTARVLYWVDLQRKLAEDEVNALNEGLERKVAERTRELEASLVQIKQLYGLLPMCSWCKKIRDDKDYWHAVETYISDRTGARFSHGICPGCVEQAMHE